MASLKSQFLESMGQPVKLGDKLVVQMDKIPITSGIVKITFLRGKTSPLQGVAIKANKGFVKLSDGRRVKLVYIWYQSDLPPSVTHEVSCQDNELRFWNIYKASEIEDLTSADAWTNNAGMIIAEVTKKKRRYSCSDGVGEFDPTDLEVDVEIE